MTSQLKDGIILRDKIQVKAKIKAKVETETYLIISNFWVLFPIQQLNIKYQCRICWNATPITRTITQS